MEDSKAADIQRLEEMLPENEQNGNIGQILRYLKTVLTIGWNFKDVATNVNKSHAFVQNLKDIEGIFDQFPDGGREAVLAVMKYQKKNCPEEMNDKCYSRFGYTTKEMWEHVQSKETIENYDEMKMGILEQIKTYRIQEANKMTQDMVKGSAFVAAVLLVKIYMTWKKIQDASNLIEDPERFTLIRNNLTKMTSLVRDLVGICETNYPANDASTITRKVNLIYTLYNKTLSQISDLRVTIDGHIQRLDLLAEYTAVDGATGFINAEIQGFQLLYVLFELISWTRFLGLAIVALFTTGIGVANCKSLCGLTREKLKDLRESLRDATRLKEELDDLYDKATQAYEDLDTAAH